ncbi:hypothetical protein [Oceanisphaera arctica]|uniref:Uncharacterized protein n=1 Tax=Oceanisphaera arctica TaxID=641510 RepID=A0A2P5TS03_9GAMM|nr:hypothetical protein [Oceanisphaera arctica]PPL18573.1 hypothetical protein UN63_01135 [Oceanisphaera arctica]GHA17488.1 hypothetical protein GCM10007082_17770 [Oceanisphaera arctica]
MKCPSCENIIAAAQITERQVKGLDIRFACPHCKVTLAVNGRATRAKLMGFVLLMSGSGVMLWGPEPAWIFGLMVGIGGGGLAFAARRRELRLQCLDKPGSVTES